MRRPHNPLDAGYWRYTRTRLTAASQLARFRKLSIDFKCIYPGSYASQDDCGGEQNMTKNCYGFVLGLAWLPLTCLGSGPIDDVAVACGTATHEVPLATETGSVGLIKNLAEDPTSIRAVAGRLLASALNGDSNPGSSACDGACAGDHKTQIVYRVAPTVYLAKNLQREECEIFESETSKHPLTFDHDEFHNIEELNEWITAFSQGRGKEGRRLYELCSSNCSPRYTFLIAEHNARYAVKAEVLCGLARDKSSDIYQVSTAVRRTCALN